MFLSGERPLWLVAARGTLVAHAMDVEGRVSGMTPFHNINCPQVLSAQNLVMYVLEVKPQILLLSFHPGHGVFEHVVGCAGIHHSLRKSEWRAEREDMPAAYAHAPRHPLSAAENPRARDAAQAGLLR